MNNYDSDDSDEEKDAGVPSPQMQDPERTERIRQMVQATSQQNIFEDKDVTDFVLRMAEKNKKMADKASLPPQQQQHPQRASDFVISDDDDDEEPADELETSYQRRHMQYQSRSPDEYPPGEAYAGDEMDEEDQIPSYDPKEDDYISYGRLCCVACALVIAMIATSILILVFVIIADGEEGTNIRNGFDGMVLPFAPSNLSEICSPDALKSFQGVLDCREPCMKAACCWEKGENGQQPVCWESHPLECAPYESCINLLTAGTDPKQTSPDTDTNPRPTSSIPVAPDGVKSCVPSNINSVDEVLKCEDACGYGKCCWKLNDPNIDACPTDPNCDGYQLCEILNAGGSAGGSGVATTPTAPPRVIPPAPSTLEDDCKEPASDTCLQSCSQATCCWMLATITYTNLAGAKVTESVMGSCSHQSDCAPYKVCTDISQDVTHASSSSEATIPRVSGLDTVCENSFDGACREACNAAPCCWKFATTAFTGADGNTIMEAMQGICSQREECKDYQVCKQLPEAGGPNGDSETTAPAEVPEPMDLVSACANSLDGICRTECHRATCCWKLATTSYTGPEGNTITESVQGSCSHLSECAAYEPCKQLSEASSSHTYSIDPAPADLSSQCADSLDGYCRDVCEQATCCWKMATTQYAGPMGDMTTEQVQGSCSQREECVGYEPCLKLPEADDVETAPHVYVPSAPANLDQVCHPASEATETVEACVEYCDAAICCWKTTTNTTTDINGQSITQSVAGSCSLQPECDAYQSCTVLNQDDSTPAAGATPAPTPATTSAPVASPTEDVEYTLEVIYDVCWNHEVQGNGINLCEKVCTPGACCWKTDEDPCDASMSCNKYEPCTKLLADAANGEPSEIETACANTQDLSDCIGFCAKGTCCFTTDLGKTCDVVSPGTVCSQYEPCEIIYKSAMNGNTR